MFALARVRFTLTPLGDLTLPEFKGYTLRGRFGDILKKTTCLFETNCLECPSPENCVFFYLFRTQISHGSLKRDLPKPFVLNPPLEERKDWKIVFELIFIGRGMEFIPLVVFLFSQLGRVGLGGSGRDGRRGKYYLEKVESLTLDGESQLLYSHTEQVLQSGVQVIQWKDFQARAERLKTLSGVTVKFLTPAQIKYGGYARQDIDFHILIESLVRRIRMLCRYHCGEELEIDLAELRTEAKRVRVEKRETFWFRQKRDPKGKGYNLNGISGQIAYRGPVERFLPYLFVGEQIGIGKKTSFGLGRYDLKWDSQIPVS